MYVAIVGSRKFKNLQLVADYVLKLPRDTVVVSGGAEGVDQKAAKTALDHGYPTPIIFRPDYAKYGKPATFIRNKEIVIKADRVVIFWDGQSTGTLNALSHAVRLNKPIEIYNENGELITVADTENKPRRLPVFIEPTVQEVIPSKQNTWVSLERKGSTTAVSRTEHGYTLDVVRSWLQKAIRRGDEEQAAWAAWQLIKFGWVAALWRTLRIIASEDIGMGDPSVAVQIDALANNAEKGTDKFSPKKEMFIGICEMQAIIVLCRAKKDWQATHLLLKQIKMYKQINDGEMQPPTPPDYVYDAHTDIGRKRGKTKQDWWKEGDALNPKSENHYSTGNDPHASIHGDKDCV